MERRQWNLILSGVFVLCFFICVQALVPVNAAEGKYYNLTTDSEIQFDNNEVKYRYNGVAIDMNGNFGLIGESGSALAPLSEVFVNALTVDCEFKLSDCSVTLKDGSASVQLLPGSKKAVVNGKSTEISEAPCLLENTLGERLYYVPTRFVATKLGFDYEWNKNSSTVNIQKSYSIKYSSDYTEKPIEVPLFADVKTDDIRIEDRYYEGKVAVYIPGNHVSKYKNNAIINRYSSITGIDLALNAANETVLIFDVSKILACTAEVKGKTLYLSFQNPRDVYSKIVVIDPGHGGYDPGAIREKVNESDLNLSIAYEYTKDLFDASDIKVYYTRVNDTFISLNDRAAFAAKVGADFFVSIHQNTFTTDAKKGISVYYSSDNKNVGSAGLTGKIMAGILLERMSEKLELKNSGRLNQRLSVTTYNTVPAALVELAFMSNPDDFTRLKDEKFRKEAGQALFDTIVEIFEAYPTAR